MAEYRRMKRRLLMVLFGLFLTFMPLLSPGDAHVLGFLAVLPGGSCTAGGPAGSALPWNMAASAMNWKLL